MPDTNVASDPLARAFSTFQAEAAAELWIPGSATARRSVRRRRAATLIATVAAIALIAALGVMTLYRSNTVGQTPAKPALSNDDLTRLSSQALTYLDVDHVNLVSPDGSVVSTYLEPDRLYGSGYGPIDFDGGQPVVPNPPVSGTYQLDAVCLGTGTVTITWGSSWVAVPCGSSPTLMTASIVLPAHPHGVLSSAASRHAGYAWVITDPELPSDQLSQLRTAATLKADGAQSLSSAYLSASGTLAQPPRDTDLGPVTTGAYAMEFVCVGRGTVTVDVAADDGSDSAEEILFCDDVAQPLHWRISKTESIVVSVSPSLAALGHAAYAYVIQQIA